MKARFLSLPGALQAEILRRTAECASCLVLSTLTLIVYGDLWLCLPFAAFTAVFAAMASLLLKRCLAGRYVMVAGVCTAVERTGLRRRVKSLTMTAPPYMVKCLPHGGLRSIEVGDTVTLYVASGAPVYEYCGCVLIDGCMTIEIAKGCSNGEK